MVVAPKRTWSGRLFFGPGRLLYAGPVGETTLHAHPTFQVVLALDGHVRLQDAHQRTVACRAAVVPSRAGHAVVGACRSAVLLHVAADDVVGRKLRTLAIAADAASGWARAGERLVALIPERLPRHRHEADALAQTLLRALEADAGRPAPTHPAVHQALRLLSAALDGDLRLATLARQVGLSSGRLSHIFSAEVGTPLRPYILWLRMQRVVEHLSAGASVTDAAHAAGFADSAHLSHVFRRMFGLAPSEIAGAVEWVAPTPR